tara:strand:+ start:273 stop:638 length:366 start_codon:yes stop_codon:yes gene_type:complete
VGLYGQIVVSINNEYLLRIHMAATERGSFLWFMMAVTQIWLSLKLMEQVDSAITTLFGTGAAACFILALVVFRQEQRELLLNPMKNLQKEVHPEQMAKQGKGLGFGVGMWILTIMVGTIFF